MCKSLNGTGCQYQIKWSTKPQPCFVDSLVESLNTQFESTLDEKYRVANVTSCIDKEINSNNSVYDYYHMIECQSYDSVRKYQSMVQQETSPFTGYQTEGHACLVDLLPFIASRAIGVNICIMENLHNIFSIITIQNPNCHHSDYVYLYKNDSHYHALVPHKNCNGNDDVITDASISELNVTVECAQQSVLHPDKIAPGLYKAGSKTGGINQPHPRRWKTRVISSACILYSQHLTDRNKKTVKRF